VYKRQEWADGVWNIANSGIGHTTPFAEELVRRCIKLWTYPGDVVLDPFAGAGTVNYVAIKNQRNAIGIELREDFYNLAIEKRFNNFTEDDYILKDSKEKMTNRFLTEKEKAELQKENKVKEAEEKKILNSKKQDLKAEIKKLEEELIRLGAKKSEIQKIKKGEI
ncbi:MAG: site-specific DNA-methyltransferase, partial [bacterium]|nr:site-specific DNA-methyltransferase [bacterium]